MSDALLNLAVMTVSSTGTGTITLASAATINGVSYLSFASAGANDQQQLYYSIQDPTGASEVGGPATYTSSSTTLTRAPIVTTSGTAAINMSSRSIVRITPPSNQMREILTTNRTYYVRTNGLDTNTGLVNSSAGAFLTVQKAIDTVAALDLSIYSVTITVSSGTFTNSTGVSAPVNLKQYVGVGPVTIAGAGSSLTTFNSTFPFGVLGSNCGVWNINSVTLTTTGGGNVLLGGATTNLSMTSVDFNTVQTSNYHVRSTSGAKARLYAHSISAGAAAAWQADNQSNITCVSVTVTLNSTPAFGTAFAQADDLSLIWAEGDTFVGNATGVRYNVVRNSVIHTAASTTYLPGNASGTTATGGQYA